DRAIARMKLVAGQPVADEEVVDQELQLIAVQLDEVSPPLLELEVTSRIGVDMSVDLVLLAPQPIRGVQNIEVQDQRGPVDLPFAEIAGHCGEPATAEEAAGIAHRIFPMHALPVRHGRARNQARPEQIRPQDGHHERLIAGLAVANGERARRLRMELDHALEESHLSLDDIQELLARLRRRPEADEVDRMAGVEGIADLALRLETADAGSRARSRVHDNDRPVSRVDFDSRWRHDT